MTIDPRQLRDAFGAFLTGVTVVTTHDVEGKPLGFTANSFTSVSLDPPLLLVCLARSSRNFAAMTGASGFAINVLSEGQKDVSNTFARPVEDRFAAVEWKVGPHGAPVFSGAAAWFDCAMEKVVDAGDHVILIGRVEAFENSGLAGLGYARGAYFSPVMADQALLAGHDLPQVISAVAERDGEILLTPDAEGRLSLPTFALEAQDALPAFEAALSGLAGVEAHSGLLYAVWQDRRDKVQHVAYRARLGPGAVSGGTLYPISDLPLEQLADPAVRDLLKRFAAESQIGNFGVYIGDHEKGRVHALAARGDA